MEHESDDYTDCNWVLLLQSLDTRTGGLGNKMTSGDHPNYCIIKIDQNDTEESPGNLKEDSLQPPGTKLRTR